MQESPLQIAHQLDFGPEVIRVRRLSGVRTMENVFRRLRGWLLYFVIQPFICIPYIALMACAPILALHINNVALNRIVLLMVAVFFYILIFWFSYIWPRGNYFVLHENGLRIRLAIKRGQIPFESIDALYIGRKLSKARRGLRQITGVLEPGQAAWLESIDGTAFTIITKDGKTHVFKTVLAMFEMADLEKLFEELIRRNPHLAPSEVKPAA